MSTPAHRFLALLAALAIASCTSSDGDRPDVGDTTAGSGVDTPIVTRDDARTANDSAGDALDTVGADAPMRTASSVALRLDGDHYVGTIPYRYTNGSGAPVYIVNCNGDVSPGLQRRIGGLWKDWWIPATNACLSPPVVIAPGGSHADTLHVWIGPQDGPFLADLVAAGDTGVFRLVWHSALSSFDGEARPFGEPVPLAERVSNPFVLRTSR